MARKVNSRVKLFDKKIKELEKAQITALDWTAEWLHTEVVQAQVVPRDTGALQNEKFFVDSFGRNQGRLSLIFEGPYARRLYFHPEYDFAQEDWEETVGDKVIKHGSNPNAKGKWMEDWAQGGSKEPQVREAFKEFYKKAAKI